MLVQGSAARAMLQSAEQLVYLAASLQKGCSRVRPARVRHDVHSPFTDPGLQRLLSLWRNAASNMICICLPAAPAPVSWVSPNPGMQPPDLLLQDSQLFQ